MINRSHELSVVQQTKLLGLARSTFYYQPCPISQDDIEIMNLIDKLHLAGPCAGSRTMRDLLEDKGIFIGRHHVRRLMGGMGIVAIYRKPNTSKSNPEHKIYPYLLKNLDINRPNQVWCMDITFIERFWRTIKYEEVYIKAYESVFEAKNEIRKFMVKYNSQRRHSNLDRKTSDQVHSFQAIQERAA